MLGYVKIDPAEMKGKHHSLYRAVYCGLCRTAARKVSFWLEPFLSYDFAFLAALRLAFHPDEVKIGKTRCAAHPLKKRAYVLPCGILYQTAVTELILTAGKMEDDLSDGDVGFFRRLAERFFLRRFRAAIRKAIRRDEGVSELYRGVQERLAAERALEKENADLDRMCEDFGSLLSFVFARNTEGEEKMILQRVGDMAGRFLYTADAADDLEKDRKNGSFNPLLRSEEDAELLKKVMLYYCDEMTLALKTGSLDPDLFAVCENVTEYGLHHQIERLFDRKTEKK